MKILTIIAVFLLSIFSLSLNDSGAEEKKTKKSKTPPLSSISQIAPSYLTTSFDMNANKISLPFWGHDIEQIYLAFSSKAQSATKDEFETTNQYEKRIKNQMNSPLLGTLSPDAVLAFVVTPLIQYDADNNLMLIKVEKSETWNRNELDESRLAIKIKTSENSSNKSIGQNAFGALAQITKYYENTFELAVHRFNDIRFWLEINVAPSKAKLLKDKIAAVVLTKSILPNISNGVISYKATFDSPTEMYHQINYIDVVLLGIWIYDKQTGEIISKITPGVPSGTHLKK